MGKVMDGLFQLSSMELPNMLDLKEIKKWADSQEINSTYSSSKLGKVILLNEKIGILPSPIGASSQEIRDLQNEYKNKSTHLYYVYPWEENSHKLLPHFKSKIGLDSRKYAAKRLEIREISNNESNDFMRKYHIQGVAGGVGKVNIALLERNTLEILAVQQFSRYRFGITRGKGSVQKSPVWEGLRLCFKPGVQIHGGASRLQKYFEQNYNPEKIISYINLSHSLGDYKSAQGFQDITDWNQLSYMWEAPKNPKIVPIVDKNGVTRENDPKESLKNPYLNPTRMAGAFGRGVGQTLYGGEKLGSRKQLREHPENGELVHNDRILEEIGYHKIWTAGQRKWVKEFA